MAQRWQFALAPNQQIVPLQLVTVSPNDGLRMCVNLRHAASAPTSA
jgi:hypothetical protein